MNDKSTFSASYKIQASSKSEAVQRAESIALEQSAEMPTDVIPDHLKDNVGAVRRVNQFSEKYWIADIEFPVSIVDDDPVQFLNVLFGNCSLLPGIKLVDAERDFINQLLSGPNHGVAGIRKLLDVSDRPLSCTALKPIGLTPPELGELALKFSSGGIDIIKDDHGLANQASANFEKRVKACVDAIKKGEQSSGKKTLYFPNITSSGSNLNKNAELAVSLGADGFLVSPQLAGLSVIIDLKKEFGSHPIMAHPAFSGAYVTDMKSGIAPEIYYGLLWRAFGADSIIYPNADGRFTFSEQTCIAINRECRNRNATYPASFPTPGGGINRDTVESWAEKYGNDTIFLIGGSLYQHPGGIEVASREFQQKLELHES